MISHRQTAVADLAEVIAIAQTFRDLALARRDFLAMTDLDADEREVLETALADREHELIDYYRGRF